MNTDRIRCTEVRERLPLYVGGDLDPDIQEGVRSHVAGCTECSQMAAAAHDARRELVASFRAAEAELPRPELWPAIRAQLRVEGLIRASDESRPAPRPALQSVTTRKRRSWSLVLAPLVAAAGFLAILQLSGLFSTSVPRLRNLDPVAPTRGPEVVNQPVIAPAGLERVDPREAVPFPPQYRRAHRQAVPGEVSPAAYLPRESR